ncbi:MAG: GtrA family protein [Acidobacteria bacterium]|nr:GtrA family protein [Acidobacteriota bacterium]
MGLKKKRRRYHDRRIAPGCDGLFSGLMVSRWLRFNAAGALGFVVQLLALGALTRIIGLHYLWATLLAVEAALLHNFVWHMKWTWADRPVATLRGITDRLARFHIANGAVSFAGNLALMRLLVGYYQLPVLPANLCAVPACSLLNFLLSHFLVFRAEPRPTSSA